VSEPMYCYRHPKRETRVSCATCGRPICTECMVATDVGIKCPDDARLPRGARAGVMKGNQVLMSILAGVGIALAGIPLAYVIFSLPFTLLISAAAGYGAGTLINRAGGRNGGPVAIVISVLATAVPFLIVLAPDLLAGALNPIPLIAACIAAVAAGVANRQN
jgi:B-box zinc finger